MSDGRITVEHDGAVAVVTIDHQTKRNALTPAMLDELIAAFGGLAEDETCRAVVLTGGGGSFSSGADLTPGEGLTPPGTPAAYASMQRVSRAVRAVAECPKPVLSAVEGVAVGLGCNLALCCDIVIAASDARFSQIFVRRGMTVDGGGTWILPRLIGLHRAKELLFTGDFVSGADGASIGMVNRAVDAGSALAEAMHLAARIAANAPIGVRMAKQAIERTMDLTLADALEAEARGQAICLSSEDLIEGVMAFVQKREPGFEGR